MPVALAHEEYQTLETEQIAPPRTPAPRAPAGRGRLGLPSAGAVPSARELYEEMRTGPHPAVVPTTRRRTRRGHRALRVTWPVALCATAVFSQLLWLTYVRGISTAASHRSSKLDSELLQLTYDINRAQNKISAASSTPRLQGLVASLHLRPATQDDIDPVSVETRPADYDIASADGPTPDAASSNVPPADVPHSDVPSRRVPGEHVPGGAR